MSFAYLKLENFRSIDTLELSFGVSNQDEPGFIVLENLSTLLSYFGNNLPLCNLFGLRRTANLWCAA